MELLDKIGETHQGLFDMAFFKPIPNIVIMAPKDFKELEQMMEFAIDLKKPVVIRYPRGREEKIEINANNKIKFGRSEILRQGKDLTIISIGNMVAKSIKIAEELKKENIDTEVINVRFLKPLDKEAILKSINKTKFIITIEDGTLIGGLASSIKELIADEKLEGIKIKSFGYPDEFIKHGTIDEIQKIYGLNNEEILKYIIENMGKKE